MNSRAVFEYNRQELGLVDAPPQASFDNLTALATKLLNAPVSVVSVVDHDNDRQFFKSQTGLSEPLCTARQTPMSHSFCQHVVSHNRPLVVEDARTHELVRNCPSIADYNIIAYLGMPFHSPSGEPLGALCVICPETRSWSEDDRHNLFMLSRCVTDLIRLEATLKTSEWLRQEQLEFASVLSHDLKSPVNTLKFLHNEMTSELEGNSSQMLDKLLAMGSSTTERMSLLIDDILNYTRVIGTSQDFVRVDLDELLEGIVADLAGDINRTQAIVSTGNLPVVMGDAMQLRILMQNLISNALKFVPDQQVPEVSIQSAVSADGRTVTISVSDNGIGIAEKHRKKIFKVFKRLHLASEYEGTGLGLALCQRIALNHCGSLSLSSTVGKGSVFSLRFPRGDVPAANDAHAGQPEN